MPPLTTAARDAILSDEFTRPEPAALRLFSVGILKILRNCGLASASPGAAPADSAREMLAIAWLLDARQSLDQVREFGDLDDATRQTMLADYEFAIDPAFFLRVKHEVALTQRAINLALLKIEPKPLPPGGAPSVSPPPNS